MFSEMKDTVVRLNHRIRAAEAEQTFLYCSTNASAVLLCVLAAHEYTVYEKVCCFERISWIRVHSIILKV